MSLMTMVKENRFIVGFLNRLDGFLLHAPSPILHIIALTMLIGQLGAFIGILMEAIAIAMSPSLVKKLEAKVPFLGKRIVKLVLFIAIGGASGFFLTRTPVIILANSVKTAALDQVRANAGVLKTELEQDGNLLSLYITVEDDIEIERAKEIGEDFVKIIEATATKAGADGEDDTEESSVPKDEENEEEKDEFDEFEEDEEELEGEKENEKKTDKKPESKPDETVPLLGPNFYEYKITVVRPDGVPLVEGVKPPPEVNVIWK